MFRKSDLWKNRHLYLMILPAALVIFCFSYLPMPGSIIAFKDYNFSDGIWRSPWVGFDNFKFYFTSGYLWRTTKNTICINLLYIFFGTISAVTFAIMLNEVRNKFARKLYQNIMFLPYFLSMVVVAQFVELLFSDRFGLINNILSRLGFNPVDWYISPQYWRQIIAGTTIWKSVGYTVIIYLAAITSIDNELFEASALDGAKRWQEIYYIMIPMLVPTIVTLVLLEIGTIFFGNFQLIYAIVKNSHGALYETIDVIDTYVFRALRDNVNFSASSAAGLYQSVMGFIVVCGSNFLVKLYNKDYALF